MHIDRAKLKEINELRQEIDENEKGFIGHKVAVKSEESEALKNKHIDILQLQTITLHHPRFRSCERSGGRRTRGANHGRHAQPVCEHKRAARARKPTASGSCGEQKSGKP